ncbi:DUF6894 family protein [Tardiphaga sp.]|jgi:hypothetical protein|uniref:DUF6894 family protein n=1 Tax=Tardiphaga sp. TaxID=1926292 RepID=UPI0037DA2213
MPRFYFSIIDGTRLDNPAGIEFPDVDAAKQHAHRIAQQMPTKTNGTSQWKIKTASSCTRRGLGQQWELRGPPDVSASQLYAVFEDAYPQSRIVGPASRLQITNSAVMLRRFLSSAWFKKAGSRYAAHCPARLSALFTTDGSQAP